MIVGHGIEKDEVLLHLQIQHLLDLQMMLYILMIKLGSCFKRWDRVFSKNIVWSKLPTSKQFAQKDGFRYFMEKEIYEQSVVVSDCMLGRVKIVR